MRHTTGRPAVGSSAGLPGAPTFRPLATRLLGLLEAREARAGEISDLFLSDTGLCLELLYEANRSMGGLGVPVTTVDRALQVLGDSVVLDLVRRCAEGPDSVRETRDLERLRQGIICGLISGALATLLETVDPAEARVAGLLRYGMPREGERGNASGSNGSPPGSEPFGAVLPGRLARAISPEDRASPNRRRSEDDLASLLTLARHMAEGLGAGFSEDKPEEQPERSQFRLEQLSEMAHDHVAADLSDALVVLGICLGITQLGAGSFVPEFARLLEKSDVSDPLPAGLPHLLRDTMRTIRTSETEARALGALLAGIRAIPGVQRILLVLNESGEAVAEAGEDTTPFFVRASDVTAIVPGFSQFLDHLQDHPGPAVLGDDRPYASLLTAFNASQALVLQLSAADRFLGSLMVVTDHPDPDGLAVSLDLLVTGAGEALQNAQLRQTSFLLTERMTKDGVTQVLQRSHLMDLLEAEVRTSNRYGRPLALAMIDVDHFKKWNDNYGHQVGDRLLRDVAQVIRDCSRDSDRVGRYGGDEFIAVLPGASLEDARSYAERVRARVENLGSIMKEACYELSLTLSIGVAATSHFPVESRALMFRADHALYRAKETGRNRVEADHG